MKIAVQAAKLIKRYKRFLADVELANGDITTIHCANTGAMTGCAEPGDTIWYSTSSNPKRKYPYSWEFTQTQDKHLICVNTMRANQLVEEALLQCKITELAHYDGFKREVKYGNENSKVDFLLSTNNQEPCYLEVKSATLLAEKNTLACAKGQGYFPDAVTIRGQKHLRELAQLSQQGTQTALLFAVLHSGIKQVSAAKHIDVEYAKLLLKAREAGVNILAYKANFALTGEEIEVELKQPIEVNFTD